MEESREAWERGEPGGCREALAVEGVIDLLPCHWGPCLPGLAAAPWAALGAQDAVGIFRIRKRQDFGSRGAVLGTAARAQACAVFECLNELFPAPERDLGGVGGGSVETSAQYAAVVRKSNTMFGRMRKGTEDPAASMSPLQSRGRGTLARLSLLKLVLSWLHYASA